MNSGIQEILEETEAIKYGHFRLSSGLHSDTYIQMAAVLTYPKTATYLGACLAEQFENSKANLVIGPALGAILVAHEVARALNCRAIFAERVFGEGLTLRRGFEVTARTRAIVVEDVFTTGWSLKETAELVEKLGGTVVGRGCLVHRHDQPDERIKALYHFTAKTISPENCSQCKENVPIEYPGSRPDNQDTKF